MWCVVCGVWCVVCVGGVLVGLWLVCGVVGPSPLLAEVPVCYSPPLLAGFCCRCWWAVPATPGWGPLAAVVCGVWCVAVVCWWGCGWCVVWLVPRHSWRRFLCATPRHSWLGFAAGAGGRSPPLLAGVRWRRWCVVCGGGVLVGLWLVCGVVGPSPLLAEVPVCYSPPLLAGFRCWWWWAVPATPGWGPLAAVVCGVWCVAVVCWWGCGWCVVWLVPRHSWRRFLCATPRHSWLGFAAGGGGRSPPLLAGVRWRRWCVVCGVWCVVCGGGVLVGLWLVCGVVGPSPLLAEVAVCYSPPLLAGFRCRWWWAVPATPGWGPLAAVVCGVWCLVCGVWWWCVGGVVAGVWCGWSLATPGGGSCVLLPASPGWISLPVVVGGPRHSWLGSAGGGGVWCVVCGGGVMVGLWLVCGVVGPSPLLAEVPVCYSPPLLAGFRCRWWWAVPATPGWGPLAAVVCGVWCVVCGVWWWCVGGVVAGVWCGWSLATPGGGCCVLLPATPGWISLPVVVGGPRHSWLGSAGGGGVWCVVCGGGVLVGLWLVCDVVGPSPLLAEVPVCYSPPLLAGFRCRWWWAVPATPGWGPLAAVVCGVWCVVCGVWWWCVGGVVAGVWCGWSLATPGGGCCVLLPASPGWISLPVVVGGPRHSWLGSAGGGGVWCVVCGGGVLVKLRLVCGVVGPSPLLAGVPVCYSPPLLAGFRCRWWWAVSATPGWGPLAAVVCSVWFVVCGVCRWCVGGVVAGVWCGWSLATPGGGSCVLLPATPGWVLLPVVVGGPRHSWLGSAGGGGVWCVVCGVWRVAVVYWWGCGWCVVWLVPRHSWRRFLCATPRHSWLGFVLGGGGRSPPLLAGVRWRRWCVVCGVWCVMCGV